MKNDFLVAMLSTLRKSSRFFFLGGGIVIIIVQAVNANIDGLD